MPVFGAYETVAQLSPTPFGSVYKAKAAGSTAATFIIKTFSPLGVDERDLKKHPDVKRFLGSAELQKRAASANSKHWAPVHEMGICEEGAYYVSTFYPTSALRLIKGKTKLDADDLHALTEAVLAGLVELRECCKRSHGNLAASTILLPRMDATGYAEAMLAEPLAAESTRACSEQGDCAALGRVLYELVMHKAYNMAGAGPIPDTIEWGRMGKRGKGWREFCNKLLGAEPADAMTLEAAQAELAKLKAKKPLVPIWAVAAAVLLLAIGGGALIWIRNRPDPNFNQKWTEYCDAYNGWFRMFGDPDARRNLTDSYYGDWIKLAEQYQKLKPSDINPEIRGGDMGGDKPPLTREGRQLTSDAITVATAVQKALLEKIKQPAKSALDGESVREGLANHLNGIVGKYSTRQWKGPAETLKGELDDFKAIDAKDPAERGKYIRQLGELFALLPRLDKIESDWGQIENRSRPVIETGDPFLKHLGELLARRLEASGKGAIGDLGNKVEELNAEMKSEAEWVGFFACFERDWKNYIAGDPKTLAAFRAESDLYVRFAKEKPELEKIHLQKWVQEVSGYRPLPDAQNPSKDPKLAQEVASLKEQLSQLSALAAQAGEQERTRVKRLDDSVQAVGKRLTDLSKEPFRVTTRESVENGVKEVQTSLTELASNVNRLREDLRMKTVASAQELIDDIDRATFPAPLKAKWNDLKLQKWGWGDADKLRKDLENNERRLALKQASDAAAKALREVESTLPDRVELSGTRNRKWGRALTSVIQAMENEQRFKSMELEALQIDFDRLTIVAPVVRPQHRRYAEWREAAEKFVLVVDELEDRMDGGYGLTLGPGEKTSPAEDLYKACGASPLWNGEVQVALKPLLDRYADLEKLKETDTTKLVALVKNDPDPAMAIDAWRRLGQMETWLRNPQDLETERTARKHIPEVIKLRTRLSRNADKFAADRLVELDKEFAQQAPLRWRKFITPRRTETELVAALNAALSAAAEFGVADWKTMQPPLPGDVQKNIFLLQNKERILNLQKMEDEKAQAQVKALIGLLPSGDGADAEVGELRGILKKLSEDQGGAAPVADVGPASPEVLKRVTWDREENGNLLTFTWRGKGHQLKFVKLEGAKLADGSSAPPYYLSTTEVTLALFSQIMSVMEEKGTADALGLPKSGDVTRGLAGPQLWRRMADGGIEPNVGVIRVQNREVRIGWLRSHTTDFDDYPRELGKERVLGPLLPLDEEKRIRETMPMQYVPPDAALFIAAAMGCRFPTYGEWKYAASIQAPNAPPWPNLRDATWAAQMAHINKLKAEVGGQAQYPDNGMLKFVGANVPTDVSATAWNAASLQAAGLGAIPAGFNDGYLWLRPVGTGNGFSDLYGNVAELVFDDAEGFQKEADKSLTGVRGFLKANADKLFVVGGSCISAPEYGVEKQQVKPEIGYADMGFRLAFVAANQSIVDRLKDVMKKQNYLVMAGPATAPAN